MAGIAENNPFRGQKRHSVTHSTLYLCGISLFLAALLRHNNIVLARDTKTLLSSVFRKRHLSLFVGSPCQDLFGPQRQWRRLGSALFRIFGCLISCGANTLHRLASLSHRSDKGASVQSPCEQAHPPDTGRYRAFFGFPPTGFGKHTMRGAGGRNKDVGKTWVGVVFRRRTVV